MVLCVLGGSLVYTVYVFMFCVFFYIYFPLRFVQLLFIVVSIAAFFWRQFFYLLFKPLEYTNVAGILLYGGAMVIV